eukprot:529458_1
MSQTALHNIIGSAFIVLSQSLFALNDAIVKYSELQLTQLLFGRFGIQLLIAAIYWNFKSFSNRNWYGDKGDIFHLWLRGCLYFLQLFTFYFALYHLPIGDALCIFFTSQYLIVFLAYYFLNEELPKWYILVPAIFLTLFGNILMSQPSFIFDYLFRNSIYEPLNSIGLISMIIALTANALCTILIRKSKEAHFIQLEFAASIQIIFVFSPLTFTANYLWINNDEIGTDAWIFNVYTVGIMALTGVIGFCSLSALVIGYQYGDATKIVWLEYINIIFAFGFQMYLWHDTPNSYEIYGALLIINGSALPLLRQVFLYFKRDRGYALVDTESGID